MGRIRQYDLKILFFVGLLVFFSIFEAILLSQHYTNKKETALDIDFSFSHLVEHILKEYPVQ